MSHLQSLKLGWSTVKVKVDLAYNEKQYRLFLKDRDIENETADLLPLDTPGQSELADNLRLKKLKWQENWAPFTWSGRAPHVEWVVDEEHHFIISVKLTYDMKNGSLEGMEIWDVMLEM